MQSRWRLCGQKTGYQKAAGHTKPLPFGISSQSLHHWLTGVEEELFRLARKRIRLFQLMQKHTGRHFAKRRRSGISSEFLCTGNLAPISQSIFMQGAQSRTLAPLMLEMRVV